MGKGFGCDVRKNFNITVILKCAMVAVLGVMLEKIIISQELFFLW